MGFIKLVVMDSAFGGSQNSIKTRLRKRSEKQTELY